MRVVGGLARGRQLKAPLGSATRPTSDRVREALFSMLTSMGAVVDADVLDLFAGSGALGIESLSRGAASAVLVDAVPAAAAAVRHNLAVLGDDRERATVVVSDAFRYLASLGPTVRFDLVLADPPYAFDRWGELMGLLAGRAGTVVAETANPWSPGPGWETVKVKKYGGTLVTIVTTAVPVSVPQTEEGES